MAGKEITEFGKRLDRVTKEKGITDASLAKKLKMAQPQLFLLKRSASPREKTLKKLSKALNKPLNYWLAGIPTPASKGTVSTKRESTVSASHKALALGLIPKGVVSKGSNLDQLKIYLVFELDGKQRKIPLF